MDPGARLDELIGGFRATQIIRAGALLGVCDELAAGPQAAPALAARLAADAGPLQRLMRGLAALGVLTESPDGRFANSRLGELLRDGVPGSMRSAAIGRTEDAWWSAWGELPRAIASGAIPFEVAHGCSYWDYTSDHAEASARFNAFMVSKTARFLPGLLAEFDFSEARHIVDVGGGNGALLGGILAASATSRGTVFDLESGLAGAGEYLAGLNVADRVDLVAGSFFEAVPAGGDVYLLRQILHDWPDERALEILRACRRAIDPGGRLLVIDQLLPERAGEDPAHRMKFEYDLHMYVLFGARERTERELTTMLAAADFRVERILPTAPEATIVAVPR